MRNVAGMPFARKDQRTEFNPLCFINRFLEQGEIFECIQYSKPGKSQLYAWNEFKSLCFKPSIIGIRILLLFFARKDLFCSL
jgi:hypothetical protein